MARSTSPRSSETVSRTRPPPASRTWTRWAPGTPDEGPTRCGGSAALRTGASCAGELSSSERRATSGRSSAPFCGGREPPTSVISTMPLAPSSRPLILDPRAPLDAALVGVLDGVHAGDVVRDPHELQGCSPAGAHDLDACRPSFEQPEHLPEVEEVELERHVDLVEDHEVELSRVDGLLRTRKRALGGLQVGGVGVLEVDGP